MDDLIAFLRARLDEDERAAYAWLPLGNPTAAERVHIARHDPARVLADVAAKRAIVDAYEHALATKENIYKMWSGLAETPLDRKTGDMRAEQGRLHDSLALWDGKGMGLSLAVRHLALPYADHPDYREEWRP